MDSVELACFLTATILAVHNIFIMIGVGVPLIFTIAMIFTIIKKEWLGVHYGYFTNGLFFFVYSASKLLYLLYPYVRLEHGAVNDNMAIALIIAFIAVFLLLITLLILLVKLFIFNKKYVEGENKLKLIILILGNRLYRTNINN